MTKRARLCPIFLFFLAVSLPAVDYYWENQQSVVTADSRFPSSATNGKASVIIWQEIKNTDKDAGEIRLSARIFNGREWLMRERFAGPFPYAGEVPSIASVSLDAENRVLVSAVTGGDTISVFISSDWGASFTETRITDPSSAVLAPRIFVRPDGGYLLFATRGNAESFSIVYARSDTGSLWSSFIPFSPAEGKAQAFLPTYATLGGTEIIVFQALYKGSSRSSFQLYSTISTDKGVSWSAPVLVTGFIEPGAAEGNAASLFENYHNQRPRLISSGGIASLVWERARTTTQKYQIYYSTLDSTGNLNSAVEMVSSGAGECSDPDVIVQNGSPAIVWFDNRRGINRIYLAQKEGFFWSEADLSRSSADSIFGRIVSVGGDIEVYWQQSQAKGTQRIIRLAPDRSILSASIVPVNFASGEKGRGDLVKVNVNLPDDSSGIAGYSYAWGYGNKPEVPETVQFLPEQRSLNLDALLDGSWYLGVRVADYAGNWSAPTYVEYRRDTLAPAPPVIADAQTDSDGFLSSNSFSLSWSLPETDTLSGYTWRFDYLAPVDLLSALGKPVSADFGENAATKLKVALPPPSVRTRGETASFTNMDNGIYALSVAAVDSVGNIGKPSVRYFALNKYIPYTYITYIDSKVDESGLVSLSIIGRGFSEGGLLSQIYLDRDGRAPYDLTLARSDRQFTVSSDRFVSGIKLSDTEEGVYRVGLVHPRRGLYFSKPLLTVNAFGTVKFGDYRYEFVPPWTRAVPEPVNYFRPDRLMLYSVLAFALAVFLFSLFGISAAARDTLQIQLEVRALITGDIMPSEKKKRTIALKNKGISLRYKLAFFTMSLVISVVLIVSIPLGVQFSANQEKTLAQGLESRVKVLLESLASGARTYLPGGDILQLGYLPGQMSALEEAVSATITGNKIDNSAVGIDFVWATNDPVINTKIDTAGFAIGSSRLVQKENDEINSRVQVLDEQAELAVGQLNEGITSLYQEVDLLSTPAKLREAGTTDRLSEIQTIVRPLEEKLANELIKIANKGTGSYPEFNTLQLSRSVTDYVFYKPVLYRQGSTPGYVHGTVRVEISTKSLLETIVKNQQDLVRTTVFIALFAVLMGVLGSLLLASIIISPIRKLAAHVAMIRDTEDKSLLEGKDLKLSSRDEIGLLGETIDEMTHSLVKAAAASKDLTVGKELQKMFIPLETDEMGRKLTCGSTKDDNAEFFGYYEGAKGVSGDYFDYIKLDQRHYAVIKCDIAGKGVPAALIMVEVATMFLDYFKDWKYEKNGFKLEYIVSRINDLIESRGFKGRFAAFTLCIFDSVSGDVHFCNAGDNLVHIYDAASRKMKLITLPECSAAGVFPSFMIDAKGGFRVVKQHLNSGDMLFLYTDGIEEAKRMFRNKDMKVFACAEPGLEKEAPHENHSVGQESEEMGPDRVVAIIEAVLSRKPYTLHKWHNSEENELFQFDFDKCEGTIEESILALVSVEKIFRLYRDPSANEFNRVQVDRKVDLFLNKYFRQYEVYCGRRKDHPEYPEYLNYTNMNEDAQYDDLTILGIRKK